MNLDLQALASTMVDAVRTNASSRWPALRALAEVEMRKLAQTLVDIERLHREGHIDEKRARLYVQMQQNVARTAFCTVKGIGLLTAGNTTTAAVGAVAAIVNRALKFKLLQDSGKGVQASFKAGRDL